MSKSKGNLKAAMRQGLGSFSSTTRDSPFSSTAESLSPPQEVTGDTKDKQKSKSKAEDFERVTLVLSTKQRDRVEALTREIQRNGVKKSERITANTVLRCLVDTLHLIDLDISRVKNEKGLREVFQKAVGAGPE